MIEEEINLLKHLGLTDSEIKVYLALLELGSTTKGPIVNKAKVASSKIYELLDKLIEKGLVSYIISSGVKYFEASSPEKIMDYLKEKESKLKKQEEKLKSLIPNLELLRISKKSNFETQIFKGIGGAETSFNDILKKLNKGDEYYVLGISKFTPRFENFVIDFHEQRAKKGIKCKIIVNELAKKTGEKLKQIKFTKVKYLQKELFTPVVFIIYEDTTLISVGLDEVFIQIRSKNLTEGLKSYVNYMWRIGKD